MFNVPIINVPAILALANCLNRRITKILVAQFALPRILIEANFSGRKIGVRAIKLLPLSLTLDCPLSYNQPSEQL